MTAWFIDPSFHIMIMKFFKMALIPYLLGCANLWQMRFNISKCNIPQVSTLNSKSYFLYKMYGIPLQIVEQQSYLELCLHLKLSLTPHVERICNKANHLFGFLSRNFNIVHHIWKNTLIHRAGLVSLECCQSIWDPYQQKYTYKQSIELLVLC